jgi:hypothetical protein
MKDGTAFGPEGEFDLLIADNANGNTERPTDLGNSFTNATGLYWGAANCSVAEIEGWEVT